MPDATSPSSRAVLSLVPIAAALLAALLAACATARSGASGATRCSDPDDSARVVAVSAQLGRRVYGACEVDRRARRAQNIRGFHPENLPDVTRPCLAAVFDIVVDAEGRVLPAPLEIVSTNSPPFALELRRKTAEWNFRPAEKGGERVAQLTRDTVVFAISQRGLVLTSSTYGTVPRCNLY